MNTYRTSFVRAAAFLGIAACALAPSQAQAWWRGGVFIGVPPVVVGPPVVPYPAPYYYPPAYYPPPYYAPPPAYYAPPPAQPYAPPPDDAQAPPPEQTPAPELSQTAPPPYGSTCYAGVYRCAAPGQTPVGAGCSCPGLGAPSYGVVQ